MTEKRKEGRSTEFGYPSAALMCSPWDNLAASNHFSHLRLHLHTNLLQLHHPVLHLLQIDPQLFLLGLHVWGRRCCVGLVPGADGTVLGGGLG